MLPAPELAQTPQSGLIADLDGEDGGDGGAGGKGGTGGIGGSGGSGGTGGIGGDGGAGVDFFGGGNSLWNEGVVEGGDAGGPSGSGGSAVRIETGASVEQIVNLGIMTGGLNGDGSRAAGIHNEGGSLSRLVNSQGGSGGDPLTYHGNLPDEYEIVINSSSQYGQLEVIDNGKDDAMSVSVSALSTYKKTGLYEDVIINVDAGNLANEDEITEAGKGLLASIVSGSVKNWDLRLLNYGEDLAIPQADLLEANWLSLRYALDYDCNQFDANGVCVSVSGQYSSYSAGDSNTEWAGVLTAAKRLNSSFRIGGFIDLHSGPDNIKGIDDVSLMPMFGVFLGYDAVGDGTGLQARASAAYQRGSADFKHLNLVGTAETVSENAGFNSFGMVAELGWGMGFGAGHIFTPFAGLTYVKSSREAYDEGSSNAAVAAPLQFDEYSATYATGVLGLRLNGPLSGNFDYRLGAGLEAMLNHDLDEFTVSGDFGKSSYDASNDPSDWALSAAAGLSYEFDPQKSIDLDAYVRQVESGESPFIAVTTGVKIGF